jgi:hypothetical protein
MESRIKVNREAFLRQLESVQPGLSTRDIIEQSSCFAFDKGRVITYNGEIACSHKIDLDISGAIRAMPLLAMLRKLREENIEIEVRESEFAVFGKKKHAHIAMEKEILLPVENLEHPKKDSWQDLPKDFTDAIGIVQQCTGRDEARFWTTCVHIHPKWVEACDNDQISRYKIKTGIEKSVLVRGSSIKHILSYGMTKFAETKKWMHYKNKEGLIISCLRFLEEYHDLSEYLDLRGEAAVLPKGLGEATARAEIFSAENQDNNRIEVELRPGKMKIKGTGAAGYYSESKKIRYSGKAMSFYISPKLLVDLTKHHTACEVTPTTLRVNGGKFTYVTCLGQLEDSDEKETD